MFFLREGGLREIVGIQPKRKLCDILCRVLCCLGSWNMSWVILGFVNGLGPMPSSRLTTSLESGIGAVGH